MNNQPPQNQPALVFRKRHILRMSEITRLTGLHRSTIYRMMARGDFPQSKSLGKRFAYWRSDEIDTWINNLLHKP